MGAVSGTEVPNIPQVSRCQTGQWMGSAAAYQFTCQSCTIIGVGGKQRHLWFAYGV